MEQVETRQPAGKRDRAMSVALLGLFFAGEWGFMFLARPDGDDPLAAQVFNLTAGALLQIGVPLLVLLLVFKETPRRWGITLVGWRHQIWQVIIISTLLLVGMNGVGIFDAVSQGKTKELAAWSVWWIGSSFSQELRYRGIVQTELGTFMSSRVAIVVQAVLFVFSPIHWAAIRQFAAAPSAGTAVFFLMAGFLGIIAGFFRAKSGSLFAPILFHFSGGFFWNPLWAVKTLYLSS